MGKRDFLSESVALLQGYLRINTSNPPGDVTRAVSFLSGILKKNGIPYRRFVSDPASGKVNLLAKLKGDESKPPILLLNHMDVVPVEREKWSVDPFGGVIKGGCVWGRGALDMKAMGMAQLMSLVLLKREGIKLSRDILWLAVCDEETGGELGAKWMTDNHYNSMKPEFVIDEGGGGSRGIFTDSGKVVFAPSVNDKQIVWLKISVSGETGHGSMPHDKNASEILSNAISRIIVSRKKT